MPALLLHPFLLGARAGSQTGRSRIGLDVAINGEVVTTPPRRLADLNHPATSPRLCNPSRGGSGRAVAPAAPSVPSLSSGANRVWGHHCQDPALFERGCCGYGGLHSGPPPLLPLTRTGGARWSRVRRGGTRGSRRGGGRVGGDGPVRGEDRPGKSKHVVRPKPPGPPTGRSHRRRNHRRPAPLPKSRILTPQLEGRGRRRRGGSAASDTRRRDGSM